MAFRSSDNIQRMELTRFQLDDVIRLPGPAQHQVKTGYKFSVNDRSSFFDWYNGFLEVRFKLQKLADGTGYGGADRITLVNGSHSLISHLMVKSAGKIIYDSDNIHRVTNVKNLLEYSDDFSRSVAKNSLCYLDTDGTTADTNIGFEARRLLTVGNNQVNVLIPLNRYSLFEELEDRMLPPMQNEINIQLTNDDELIYKAGGAVNGRIVVNKFLLWVPRIIPKDSMFESFISNYIKPSKWSYLKEMYQMSAPTLVSGFYQINSSIDNVEHVFVYLQRAKMNTSTENPYLFDTFKTNANNTNCTLSNCKLEYGNNVFYPEVEYDTESKVRIFNDLMAYGHRRNDFNTGTQLNLSNYDTLFSIVYFNLTYQSEKITRDPKQLIFRYKLNIPSTDQISVHAVVLYREEIIVDKIGNELTIV